VTGFLDDLRYAVRALGRSRAFSTAVLFLLTLGIAGTTAMFSVVNAVLLRLPFSDAEQLVRFTTYDSVHQAEGEISYVDVREWRRANRSFEDIAAIGSTNWGLTLQEGPRVNVPYAAVSGNFFELLGATPLLGRTFTEVDDVVNGKHVAVLSYSFWRSRFGGDAAIVGRSIRMNGSSFSILGVMPPTFRYPSGATMWAPLLPEISADGSLDLVNSRGVNFLHALGRLRAGVTKEAAEADVARFIDREGDWRKNDRIRSTPIVDDYFGRARWALLVALGAALLLLAMACASVAGLLLVRTTRREKEWALRRALGAGDWRLVRLVLAEHEVLVLASVMVGLACVPALVKAIQDVDSTGLLRDYPIHVDRRVAAFCAAASLFTLVASSLPSLWRLVIAPRRDATWMGIRRAPVARARGWLVAVEVSVTTVLLVWSALMAQSLVKLSSLNLGFQPDRMLVVGVGATDGLTPQQQDARVLAMVAELRATDGVGNAAGVSRAPLLGPIGLDSAVLPEGEPLVQASWDRHPPVNAEATTPGYFDTMGIRLLEGRDFDERDSGDAPGVAIVSASLARQLWPGENAIGKRLQHRVGRRGTRAAEGWCTVVGVSADVRYREIERSRLDLYLPMPQAFSEIESVVVRANRDPASLAPAIRARLAGRSVDAAEDVRLMSSMLADRTSIWHMTFSVLATYGVIAVILAAAGLYGLLSYVVEERTHEIGVRVALGAGPWRIRRIIVGGMTSCVAVGMAAGMAAAASGAGVMRSLVFEVSPLDPEAFAAAAVLLLGVALLSTWRPARRAATIDPARALRAE